MHHKRKSSTLCQSCHGVASQGCMRPRSMGWTSPGAIPHAIVGGTSGRTRASGAPMPHGWQRRRGRSPDSVRTRSLRARRESPSRRTPCRSTFHLTPQGRLNRNLREGSQEQRQCCRPEQADGHWKEAKDIQRPRGDNPGNSKADLDVLALIQCDRSTTQKGGLLAADRRMTDGLAQYPGQTMSGQLISRTH